MGINREIAKCQKDYLRIFLQDMPDAAKHFHTEIFYIKMY